MLSPNTQLLACSKQLLRISSANRVTLTSTGTLTQAKTHQCLHRDQDTAQGPQATGQETAPSGTAEPPVHSNKWPVSSNSPAHPPSKKTLLNRCQSPQPLGKMLGQEAQCGDTGFCFLWFLGHRMLSPASASSQSPCDPANQRRPRVQRVSPGIGPRLSMATQLPVCKFKSSRLTGALMLIHADQLFTSQGSHC